MNRKFSCIIPTLASDYRDTNAHLFMMFDKLPISRLIFIGPNELGKEVMNDATEHDMTDRIEYINENDILSFDAVKQSYYIRLNEIDAQYGKPEKIARTGWYYQQFLKLEFYKICPDEYYLCWDADTIPLKNIEMLNPSGTPYFDIRSEHVNSYFDTIKNLFGFDKAIKQSFVSEHMLFSKYLVEEMLEDILSSSLKGNTFYEKIFSAIRQPFQGFSEFETYGSWVAQKHPLAYRLRDWKSIRNTSFLINRNDLTDDDLNWLATGFDAASFERYQQTQPELTELFRNPRYRSRLTADIFYKELLETGIFGEYRDGGLLDGDNLYPS